MDFLESVDLPPAWLFLVLALPHLWYFWVLVHPASTKRTAALFHTDAVDWFAGVALALNVLQFAALFAFAYTSPLFSAERVLALLKEDAEWWRLPVALPVFGVGLVFKVAIFTAIGKKGVYYGAKFGHSIPWVNGFPFSVTAHPQYLGSSLCISAVGLVLSDPSAPGLSLLPAWWIALYFITGLAEEGLCHSVPPFSPLPDGASPDADWESRPVVAAEAVRLLLLAPLVALRWAAALKLFLLSALAARLVSAPARKAALLRRGASAALWWLGFSLERSGEAAPPATVVANSLSYLDALLLTAALGLVAAPPARLPLGYGAWLALAQAEPLATVAFPEPRPGPGGCLRPFASLSAATDVQPAALSYSAGNSFSASWLGGSWLSALAHFYRVSAAWLKTARVALLPPGPAAGAEAAISAQLGWPVLGGRAASRGRALSPAPRARAAPASPSPAPRSGRKAAGVRAASPAATRSASPGLESPRARRAAARA